MGELCRFDVTPLAQPRLINKLPYHNVNYTSQDYHSMKARILELLKANFAEDFNYVNESSLAVMLIECWLALGDMLSFKIDQLANELFIDTVTELENAFRLAKLVGFKPLPPLPAKAMFMLKTNNVYTSDLVVKTPLIIDLDTFGSSFNYELYPADHNNNPIMNADIVIPAGSTYTDAVVGVEGRTRTYTFTSTGKANQIFTVPFENVYHGSIKVDIDNTMWEEVEDFTLYKPRAEYVVEYGAYYKPSLVFGDNVAGLIPPQGAKINVTFRIPNPSTAEIVSGAFDTKVFSMIPGVVNHVVINVKNHTKSEFGYPGDGINDIRKKLPAYLRTQNRAVSGGDYKYLTDSFATSYDGAIGKCNVVLRNHGCAGNIIDIIVLAKTGDYRLIKANDGLKAALYEELRKKRMFTDYVCIKDGEVISTDVIVDAHVNSVYKKYENEIKAKVLERLEDYFALSNWDFGQALKEKDLIKALAGIKEVTHFDITFTTNREMPTMSSEAIVMAKYNEIVRPESLAINFVYRSSGDE